MKDALLDFIGSLRNAGLTVTVSEALDCCRGLTFINVLDRDQFRALLKTTLISNHEDIPLFEKLFHMYFEKNAQPAEGEAALEILKASGSMLFQDGVFSPMFQAMILEGMDAVIPFAFPGGKNDGIHGDAAKVMAAFAAVKAAGRIEAEDWDGQVIDLMNLLAGSGMTEKDRDMVRTALETRIAAINSVVRNFIDTEKMAIKKRIRTGRNISPDMEFTRICERDIEYMHQAVNELVKKIKDENCLRQRKLRHGAIDIKRTLRKSMQYGGMPFRIEYRKRKKARGRIVALCDVSNSTRHASTFMLMLLYSLQNRFSDVRSYVFIDRPVEITQHLENNRVDEAIRESLESINADYGYTFYGGVFSRFYEDDLDAVNYKTTVIIIGDGRNNFLDSHEWCLEKISSRAKRLFWLNPEREELWGTGDSDALKYRPYCREMRECRNLEQLSEFIETIIV